MSQTRLPPLVSAIIPTHRRPQLVVRAIQSVLRQTERRIEAIVVIDGSDTETRAMVEQIASPLVTCIETGKKAGPAEARNIGVRAARGKYVALLDDDDEWTPDKVAVQLRMVDDHELAGRDFILSSRTQCRASDGVSIICPDRLYNGSGNLGEYLFDRPTPTARPGFIPTGTFFMPRSLVLRVPFRNHEAHEEMSWLLYCVDYERVPLLMAEEVLFTHHLNVDTRAQTQSWRASLTFARDHRRYMSGRAFAGLLSTTTAWRAKRQAGLSALGEIAWAMYQDGSARAMHWLTLAGIVMLPLGAMDKWRRRR